MVYIGREKERDQDLRGVWLDFFCTEKFGGFLSYLVARAVIGSSYIFHGHKIFSQRWEKILTEGARMEATRLGCWATRKGSCKVGRAEGKRPM
jgi:hypothetical protein